MLENLLLMDNTSTNDASHYSKTEVGVFLDFTGSEIIDLISNRPIVNNGCTLENFNGFNVLKTNNLLSSNTNKIIIDLNDPVFWPGTSDFGLEISYYLLSFPYTRAMMVGLGHLATGLNATPECGYLSTLNNGYGAVEVNDGLVNIYKGSLGTNNLTGKWLNFSINRVNGILRGYWKGTKISDGSPSTKNMAIPTNVDKRKLLVGSIQGSANYTFNGYIGYVHYRVGKAIRTDDFIPPSIHGL